jgi:hypothetical protein
MLLQNGVSRARLGAAAELGLGQKGMWSGPEAPNSSGADEVPPAKRRGLNHQGVPPAERGKPIALLSEDSKGTRKAT